MAAVDAACQWKWVDTARLGVTGGSYGGFMTAWLIGHTDRFRAAVSQRGCYNFASFYGTSDIGPWFGDYILGGPVYEREALYRERSPLTYARADAHAAAADPQRATTCAVRSNRPSSSSSSCGAWARSKSRWFAFPKKATT